MEASDVFHYNRVCICSGGVLTVTPWNGSTGGQINLVVEMDVVIEQGGLIDLTGVGYTGGDTVCANTGTSNTGACHPGFDGGGKGGTSSSSYGSTGGGGGGHGTAGGNASPNTYNGGNRSGGVGGNAMTPQQKVMGSGGGGGSGYINAGGRGGKGGGLLSIVCQSFENKGSIVCDGAAGVSAVAGYGSGGGGGSGGSIVIDCKQLVLAGHMSATGGVGGVKGVTTYPGINSDGGAGGSGAVSFSYQVCHCQQEDLIKIAPTPKIQILT